MFGSSLFTEFERTCRGAGNQNENEMKTNGNVASITTNSFVDTMWANTIVVALALDKMWHSMVEKNSTQVSAG